MRTFLLFVGCCLVAGILCNPTYAANNANQISAKTIKNIKEGVRTDDSGKYKQAEVTVIKLVRGLALVEIKLKGQKPIKGYVEDDEGTSGGWNLIATDDNPQSLVYLKAFPETTLKALGFEAEPQKNPTTLNTASTANKNTDTIEPFGNFTWHDGLKDVIDKLNAIGSIENTTIYSRSFMSNFNSTGKINFNELLDYIDRIETDTFALNRSTIDDIIIGKYVDTQITISASPIIIYNSKYEISIMLKSNPGFALIKPGSTLTSSNKIKYPLLITQISIKPIDTNDINKLNSFKDVSKELYNKYKKFNNPKNEIVVYSRSPYTLDKYKEFSTTTVFLDKVFNCIAGQVTDKLNSKFYAREFQFSYSSQAYHDAYTKKYAERVKDIETASNRGKPDMKGGL